MKKNKKSNIQRDDKCCLSNNQLAFDWLKKVVSCQVIFFFTGSFHSSLVFSLTHFTPYFFYFFCTIWCFVTINYHFYSRLIFCKTQGIAMKLWCWNIIPVQNIIWASHEFPLIMFFILILYLLSSTFYNFFLRRLFFHWPFLNWIFFPF